MVPFGAALGAAARGLGAVARAAIPAPARKAAVAALGRATSGTGRAAPAGTPPSGQGSILSLTSGRLTNALYSLDALGRFKDRFESAVVPTFEHAITVAVKGGPEASMTRTWQLACALAFGQYRYCIGATGGVSMDFTWDISHKAVQISIYYSLAYNADLGARAFIQRGPIVETAGGAFPPWLQSGKLFRELGNGRIIPPVLGGKPFGADRDNHNLMVQEAQAALVKAGLASDFQLLPDEGRLLLTEMKTNPDVQPPRPTDYYGLISAVSNALNDPGYLPAAPPPGPRFGNPLGTQIFRPGERLSDGALGGRLRLALQPAYVNVIGGLAALFNIGAQAYQLFFNGVGLDNYKKPTTSYQPNVQGPRNKGTR